MENIWEIYEELNELVCVTDIDTYGLVYMNRKLREMCGLKPDEDYRGRKCHEMLLNCLEPCAMCDNCKLEKGKFLEYERYNPAFNRNYMNKATLLEDGDKKYRMEIMIDVTVFERRGKKLERYQDMERFVFEGLRVAMNEAIGDKAVNVVLEYLGEALHGERIYVFEKNKNGCDDNTYEWVANGVTPEKENLQGLPPEVCAHWYSNFVEGKNITIDDLENIRENDPLQYENLKRQNIHSLVVVPLYDEGKVIGFYGVDNPPKGSLDYAENLLQVMGFFIVTFLRRRNLFNRLNFMGSHDQLTGLGNRYAMEEYIQGMMGEKKCGVVYSDVTGLKQVNDKQGHKAGDDLLVRASKALKEVFGSRGLFRIGGDEFLVLCKNIEEAELEEKAAQLREAAQKHDVNLAIGTFWEPEECNDIDVFLVKAETRMYDDKSAYYKRTGIERRRR